MQATSTACQPDTVRAATAGAARAAAGASTGTALTAPGCEKPPRAPSAVRSSAAKAPQAAATPAAGAVPPQAPRAVRSSAAKPTQAAEAVPPKKIASAAPASPARQKPAEAASGGPNKTEGTREEGRGETGPPLKGSTCVLQCSQVFEIFVPVPKAGEGMPTPCAHHPRQENAILQSCSRIGQTGKAAACVAKGRFLSPFRWSALGTGTACAQSTSRNA